MIIAEAAAVDQQTSRVSAEAAAVMMSIVIKVGMMPVVEAMREKVTEGRLDQQDIQSNMFVSHRNIAV
jgi:hypothetical protein